MSLTLASSIPVLGLERFCPRKGCPWIFFCVLGLGLEPYVLDSTSDKLRHFVPTRTLKVVHFSMFNSVLQYSLLNWGRVCKSHLQKSSILQNKIIRACLLCSRRDSMALLHSKFGVLKLEDMINMEIAKFMFKFYNKMLPNSFDSYFTKLDSIHSYNTRQKSTNEFFTIVPELKWDKRNFIISAYKFGKISLKKIVKSRSTDLKSYLK